ncbi:MAG: hypothetical protein PHC64_01335 [Candidatus Gastranaerophilales bacterium]|nr:hypothetical protein [Candidatus Gastranaerophilales bacterium]
MAKREKVKTNREKRARGQEGKKANFLFHTYFFASLRLCIFASLLLFAFFAPVFAETSVLKAGVSIDKVPKELYGTWRVSSKILSTNGEGLFKKDSVDLWNLSRAGDVITLDNPFSGAKASIIISNIDGNAIKFKKIGDYDGQKLTDTVQLVLEKDKFKGVNNLKLDTVSEIDGKAIQTKWATYSLTGEKISGESIKWSEQGTGNGK